MITVTLFDYYEKMFILTNIWMIGRNSMKQLYLKNFFFYSHLNTEDITDADCVHAKEFVKVLK